MPWEYKGRDQGDHFYKPGNAKDFQQTTGSQERGLEQAPSQSSGGTDAADTWILDFLPPELWDNKFVLF